MRGRGLVASKTASARSNVAAFILRTGFDVMDRKHPCGKMISEIWLDSAYDALMTVEALRSAGYRVWEARNLVESHHSRSLNPLCDE